MGKVSYAVLDDMEKYNPNFDRKLYENMDELEAKNIFKNWYILTLKAVDLLTWCRVNEPSDEMYYKKGYWRQIMLIRDNINRIFYSDYDEYENNPVMVISTHTSKSILLPVYEINLKKYGVRMILRDNFYDWKVSIISEKEINTDFMGLFKEDGKIHSCYCEGFSKDLVFPSYSENKSTFTFEICDDYKLYTFMYILNYWLEKNIIKM